MITLVLFIITASIIFLITMLGILLYDIRTIAIDKAHHQSPHARKWRIRPVVLIETDGTPSTSLLQSIKQNRYKHAVLTDKHEQLPAGAFRMAVAPDTILAPKAIHESVRKLLGNTSLAGAPIETRIHSVHTITELFHAYAAVAKQPFMVARSGFGILSQQSLSRREWSKRDTIYNIMSYLVRWCNCLFFVYACYAGADLRQPELLLLYSIGLSLWLVWSIFRTSSLRFSQKLILFGLHPVAFVYFVYQTIATVLSFPTLHTLPQNAMINR